MDVLRIGNACGFWGDWPGAPLQLLTQAPDLNVLTLDYLAEVSMSILARQRQHNPELGYPNDFLDVVRSLAPLWASGRRFTLVTNGGGLNPRGCAQACAAILKQAGCKLRIGIVAGDDVFPILRASRDPNAFAHLETQRPLKSVADRLVTANAYLGAAPLAEALAGGADLVISGRVADPSLTVAPCLAHFEWVPSDYDRLAGATVAGHLIECGTQVTGGISTDWLSLDNADIGYPIAEVSSDGSCVITKPAGTGGEVSRRTVKEQLLYEIGDPSSYLSPDATVSFLSLALREAGENRVGVSGATGRPPPSSYKVSATYQAGWQAAAMLTIVGHDAVAKARRAGEVILEQLEKRDVKPSKLRIECLGSGDAMDGILGERSDLTETVLRIAASDPNRQVMEEFARQIVPLVTCGPQGTTGYFDARPHVRPAFGYWPTVIDRKLVTPTVEFMETSS
jgi:hypothetical protein